MAISGLRWPVPRMHDDFSNLLLAETLCLGESAIQHRLRQNPGNVSCIGHTNVYIQVPDRPRALFEHWKNGRRFTSLWVVVLCCLGNGLFDMDACLDIHSTLGVGSRFASCDTSLLAEWLGSGVYAWMVTDVGMRACIGQRSPASKSSRTGRATSSRLHDAVGIGLGGCLVCFRDI